MVDLRGAVKFVKDPVMDKEILAVIGAEPSITEPHACLTRDDLAKRKLSRKQYEYWSFRSKYEAMKRNGHNGELYRFPTH